VDHALEIGNVSKRSHMDWSSKPMFVHVAVGAALLALVAAGVAAAAAELRVSPTPTVAAGEKLFVSSGCSSCHTFRAASASGKVGPNLDLVKLQTTQIVLQVTKGGCAIMTKAACSKYKFSMSSFENRLSKTQISEIAAFVYSDRNKAPASSMKAASPKTTTTTAVAPKTTTTTAAPTTTAVAPTTTAAAPTTTPNTGGTDTLDGCPAGQTIPTSGNSDGDGDETGGPSDMDGCI
jgi:mono/diheme cytochrome c family protein